MNEEKLKNEKNAIIDEMEQPIKCGRKQRKTGAVK